MNPTNFLIGRGELLTHDIPGPKRAPGKKEAYSLDEARARLVPQFTATADAINRLPSEDCPGDMGVARLLMNPSYIARSYFPSALLHQAGLESIGSRTMPVKPEKWTRKKPVADTTTTELFVSGRRAAFRQLAALAGQMRPLSHEAIDLARVESFAAFHAKEKLVPYINARDTFFEVGLQLPGEERGQVQAAFLTLSDKLKVKPYPDLSFSAGNLWFLPVHGEMKAVEQLAAFSFVRVVRPVPKLRSMRPVTRAGAVAIPCTLPTEAPMSSEPKVAILDGGLPGDAPLKPWLKTYRKMDENAADDADGPAHGS